MKKLCLFVFGTMVMLCQMSAEIISITSHLTGVTNSNGFYYAPAVSTNVPNRVHIRTTTTNPEFELAKSYAQEVFTYEMSRLEIPNLSYIDVEATFDTNVAFDYGEIARVVVNYDPSSNVNSSGYYPYVELRDVNANILYPLSIVNQSNAEEPDGVVPCMHIYLDPTANYYYGTDGNVGNNQYDMVTVLLRCLTIGCGFQSSLQVVDNVLSLSDCSTSLCYINSFDARIKNDSNIYLYNVTPTHAGLTDFLDLHRVYIEGNGGDYYVEELNNDGEYGCENIDFSSGTLNFLSFNIYEGNDDMELMDSYVEQGVAIHTITPHTMNVLRALGWEYDIPVGYERPNVSIVGNRNFLYPDSTYTFTLTTGYSPTSFSCLLYASDSVYSLSNSFSNDVLSVSYSSLPSQFNWERNQTTKAIVGRVYSSYVYQDRNGNLLSIPLSRDVQIPYRPNNLIAQVDTTSSGNALNVAIRAFANGSSYYIVTTRNFSSMLTQMDTIASDLLDYTISNLDATQQHSVSIVGVNTYGTSDAYSFVVGSGTATLTMGITISGYNLCYNFTCGGVLVSNVDVASAQIFTTAGVLEMAATTRPSENINISSLTTGTHILRVTLSNGQVFSKTFRKRPSMV